MAVSAGLWSSCALLSNGTAKCWGANMYGQLGDGTETDSRIPVTVKGLTGAVSLDDRAGYHACVILDNSGAKCWGSGYLGDLGDGYQSTPSPVGDVWGLTRITAISTGGNSSCAALSDGTAWCWGDDALGDYQASVRPVQVPGFTGVTTIATSGATTCALRAGGTVVCFGENEVGQLGNGSIDPRPNYDIPATAAAPVKGLSGAVAISMGEFGACVLIDDGSVRCWGSNQHGALGIGTDTPDASSTPVTVSGIGQAMAITVGDRYACALLSDGTVRCWGNNENGTLGDGTGDDSSTPVPVVGLSHVTAISAGIEHACALLDDGSVECWGLNIGSIGTGPFGPDMCGGGSCSKVPTPVSLAP